jgi:O-antigen/teichoic acid export membrane protein
MSRLRSWLRSEFIRHSAWVFGAMMALNVANYVYHFFMTRWLGPATYGSLSSLLAVTSLISIPSAILTMIVVKYAAEFHAVGDLAKLRTLCDRILRFSGALALLMLIAVLAAGHYVAAYIHLSDWTGVAVCGVIAAVGLVTPGSRGILQGVQDFRSLAFSIAIEGFGKCLFGVWLTFAGFGIRGALIGYAAGSLLSLLYSIVALKPHMTGVRERLRMDYRRLVRATAAVAIVTVTLQVVTFIDVVLVKHYFSAQEAGLYSGVALTGKIMLFVVSFVPGILLPKAAAAAARGEKARPLMLQAGGLTLLICLSALGVFFTMPGLVLRIVAGVAYVVAAPYLFGYALAMSLLALSGIVANYQIAMHRYFFVIPCALVCAAEVGAIALFHRSLTEVVMLLVGFNAMILLSTALRSPRGALASRGLLPAWRFSGDIDAA